MSHQAEAAALCMQAFGNSETGEMSGGFALLHAMGTGKTLTALGTFLMLHEQGLAETLFVACPSSVVSAWQRDARKVAENGTDIEVVPLTQKGSSKRVKVLQDALNQRSAARRRGEVPAPLVVAMNYESCPLIIDELLKADFDMIACDESQRIKDSSTKQARALHKLGARARYRLIMTGTPAAEGVEGWFSQFKFLDPSVFGKSIVNYRSKFMITTMVGPPGKQFPKVRANPEMLPELERIVMSRSHQVSRDDALDLPGETFVPVEFELSPSGRRAYDQMLYESIAVLEDEFGEYGVALADNALSRLIRLQQITSGFVMDHEGNLQEVCTGKRDALKGLLETIKDEGNKAIVFHRWSWDGLEIEKIARKLHPKIEPCIINGSVPTGERDAIIDRFQHGDGQIFIAQIKAAGLGIDLYAAQDSIFYSTGHSSEQFEQAAARAYRKGQTRPVTHHLIQARDTVDPTVFKALKEKRNIEREFVEGGWERFIRSVGCQT